MESSAATGALGAKLSPDPAGLIVGPRAAQSPVIRTRQGRQQPRDDGFKPTRLIQRPLMNQSFRKHRVSTRQTRTPPSFGTEQPFDSRQPLFTSAVPGPSAGGGCGPRPHCRRSRYRRPDGCRWVSLANIVASSSVKRVRSDPLNRCLHLDRVALSLILAPALLSDVPDRWEVLLRDRRDAVAPHDLFDAIKESKSKLSGAPLSSPATSAAGQPMPHASRCANTTLDKSRRPRGGVRSVHVSSLQCHKEATSPTHLHPCAYSRHR